MCETSTKLLTIVPEAILLYKKIFKMFVNITICKKKTIGFSTAKWIINKSKEQPYICKCAKLHSGN